MPNDPNGHILAALLVAWFCAFFAVKIAAGWSFGPDAAEPDCPLHPNQPTCAHRKRKE